MFALRDRQTRKRQLARLDNPAQAQMASALRAQIAALQEQPRGNESPWWAGVRQQLVRQLRAGDPRAFLRWRPIRETMLVPHVPYVEDELRALQASGAWTATWSTVLEEDPTGCPPSYPALPSSSANLIHHAFHVQRLREVSGRSLEDFTQIVEFGGGYGSFARLAFRLGFTGVYHVHDFPEFAALQDYFLRSVLAARGQETPVTFTASADSAHAPAPDGDAGLFVGLWSLSETPLAEREPWIDAIDGASAALLAFQDEFEATDNRAWFEALQTTAPRLRWTISEIAHLPGNSYAIGRR
jgi:plasmid stabilization system protein ParE